MIPTTRANPSWRSEPSGLERNEAKLHAVIAAAEEIRPPVWPIARTIPDRRPTQVRLLAEPVHQEDVVIDADGHEQHEQEVGDLPVEPLGPEDRDEDQVRGPEREGVGQEHRGDQVQARQRVAEGEEQDQEDADRHEEPALELVGLGQRPDIGRLGVRRR